MRFLLFAFIMTCLAHMGHESFDDNPSVSDNLVDDHLNQTISDDNPSVSDNFADGRNGTYPKSVTFTSSDLTYKTSSSFAFLGLMIFFM